MWKCHWNSHGKRPLYETVVELATKESDYRYETVAETATEKCRNSHGRILYETVVKTARKTTRTTPCDNNPVHLGTADSATLPCIKLHVWTRQVAPVHSLLIRWGLPRISLAICRSIVRNYPGGSPPLFGIEATIFFVIRLNVPGAPVALDLPVACGTGLLLQAPEKHRL